MLRPEGQRDRSLRLQQVWQAVLIQCCACFRTGFGGIVDALLDAGADVDVSTNDGWIPLHEACFNGHPDIAQRLIETGSQVSPATSRCCVSLHAVGNIIEPAGRFTSVMPRGFAMRLACR